MKIDFYNRKAFVIIASILMSVNNGLGGIFLPYFSKIKFHISSSELGGLACISSIAYVISALSVAKVERKFKLKKSFLIFIVPQLLGLISVFFIESKIFLLIPFLLVGVAQGGWWPLVEGAMCDGQNSVQKKRAISFFNFSWLFGLIIGPPIVGRLYELNVMWPLWAGIFILLMMFILVLIPQSLVIAQWKMQKTKELNQPESLKYFIKWGIILNLISYLFISSFRSILVEFTNPLGISSSEYEIIQASFNFGILSFMYILMKYDFWQFSKKLIFAGVVLYMFLVLALANSSHFQQLLYISFLIGAPTSLFYFSSLYYGMLGAKSGSDHGGHHEAMIGTGQSIGPLISGVLISLTGDPRAMLYWLVLVLMLAGVSMVILKKN